MSRLPQHVGPDLVCDANVILGYSVGDGQRTAPRLDGPARLRSGTVVYDGTQIGRRFETGHNVVIRENCTIGECVSVWTGSVVDYGCTVGNRVKVHSNCYIAQYSVLEDDSFLAPGVTFANDVYPGRLDSARAMAGPRIGAGAQVGCNCTLLPYVKVGAGALIGAGSVVTRDVPDGMLAYGVPARVIRPVPDLDSLEKRFLRRNVPRPSSQP